MLFRYRARNFPDTLTAAESLQWNQQRLERLHRPSDDRQLNPGAFMQEVSAARQVKQGDSRAQNILDHLEAWCEELCRAD
jgi:exodeoxyribonuclease-1